MVRLNLNERQRSQLVKPSEEISDRCSFKLIMQQVAKTGQEIPETLGFYDHVIIML